MGKWQILLDKKLKWLLERVTASAFYQAEVMQPWPILSRKSFLTVVVSVVELGIWRGWGKGVVL